MDIITILAIGLLLLLGGSFYLFLRPGGLVENIIGNRDRKLVVMEAQISDALGRIATVAAEVAENASYAQHNVAQVKNRLTSLETKAGKANAAQNKEELQHAFLQFLQQQQQQQITGG